MNEQEHLNYSRIAEAIEYIKDNLKTQPNQDEVVEKVHLSPFRFEAIFQKMNNL